MAKCAWPTCRDEATHNQYCFRHNKVYGKATIKQEDQSEQRTKEEKLYEQAKKKFLADHQLCEVKGCKNLATEVHHKKGRIGALLYNILFFLAVCWKCHKKIEKNPGWAKQEGYSLFRTHK